MSYWSKNDLNFLIKNYSKKGAEFCAKNLNKSKNSIYVKAHRLNLKVPKKLKKKLQQEKLDYIKKQKTDFKINTQLFIKNFTKESAYILGLIYADGSITSCENSGHCKNKIIINLVAEDANNLLDVFLKTGKWAKHYVQQKNRRKQMNINTSNRPLVHFLIKNGYSPRNKTSPDKLLNIIPLNLRQYWFRGFVDGDGSFGFYPKKRAKYFSISGPYNQDWNFMINLFKKLSIKKFKISHYISNKTGHKYSQLRTQNKDGINKIGKYIYKRFVIDKIGLNRKYNKWAEIIKYSYR